MALLAMTALAACAPGSGVEDYGATIAQNRALKDESFRSSPDSPIPPDKRNVLLPLSYFAIDEAFAVPAELELSAAIGHGCRCRRPLASSATTTRVGTLEVQRCKGQPHAAHRVHRRRGNSCRGCSCRSPISPAARRPTPAGRYMDLDPTVTGIYVVDFNVAYHPFCYYNAEYDVRCRPRRTDSRCRFAPASGCARRTGRSRDD